MNLILCGMMGAGKTSVGKEVAKALGWRWYDTDQLIVERHGNVTEIFAKHGETYFRQLETEILKELVQADCMVLSVGGGLVLREENVSLLRKNGQIVFLCASVETLEKRLQLDSSRPLLQTEESLRERLQRLLKERTPIYEAVADFTVNVDGKTLEEIAAEIVSQIR
jgi:shikimate kinase